MSCSSCKVCWRLIQNPSNLAFCVLMLDITLSVLCLQHIWVVGLLCCGIACSGDVRLWNVVVFRELGMVNQWMFIMIRGFLLLAIYGFYLHELWILVCHFCLNITIWKLEFTIDKDLFSASKNLMQFWKFQLKDYTNQIN